MRRIVPVDLIGLDLDLDLVYLLLDLAITQTACTQQLQGIQRPYSSAAMYGSSSAQKPAVLLLCQASGTGPQL